MTTFIKSFLTFVFVLLVQFFFISPQIAFSATSPDLGTSASFSVLGFSTVTNTGASTLSGDLGLWSGSSIIGFFGTTANEGPGIVSGAVHQTDSVAQQAQSDAATADANLLSQTATSSVGPVLDGLTLVPGVYDIGAGRLNGGTLILDGDGVYIFRASSDFVSSGSISLTNGARGCDVFWHVATQATINGSSFVGTIIAGSDATGIAFGNGVRLDGRAIAILGSVTMDTNTVSGPSCAAVDTTPSPTPVATGTPFDACLNIDGIQTGLPEGMHFDSTGVNCVNWGSSGPSQNEGTTTTNTTSTGQVLGSTTLASTGDSKSKIGLFLMVLGSSLILTSLYAFKKKVI